VTKPHPDIRVNPMVGDLVG